MESTLHEQLRQARRRVNHTRRVFERRRDRASMNGFLDAIKTYEATAHVWCVTQLREQPSEEAAVLQSMTYTN